MTTPTPPRDLSEHDRAGIAGTIHECDPAAVERLRALMAQQQPPRWLEATATPVQRRRASPPTCNARRIARADKVRVVLSDEQMATT
jgi:hypothetical protein